MISEHELRASEAIARLFGSASLRLPDAVRGLVDALFLDDRYNYSTIVSPAVDEKLSEFHGLADNLVIVGGASKNRIRRMYLDEYALTLRMSSENIDSYDQPRDEQSAEVTAGPAAGNTITSRATELLIVEKFRDPDRGTTVFFCVGRKGDTTWAAAEYLSRNWRTLYKEFGKENFALCLGVADPEYTYEYRRPTRLWAGQS